MLSAYPDISRSGLFGLENHVHVHVVDEPTGTGGMGISTRGGERRGQKVSYVYLRAIDAQVQRLLLLRPYLLMSSNDHQSLVKQLNNTGRCSKHMARVSTRNTS